MLIILQNIKERVSVGFVGGSDIEKQQEQLCGQGLRLLYNYNKLLLYLTIPFLKTGLKPLKAVN